VPIPACLCRLFLAVLICLCAFGITLHAQSPHPVQTSQDDPLKRPRPDRTQKKLKHGQTEDSYKKWRDNDVKDIITPEELAAFNKLSNDSERASFVEAFWRRRDPTPDTEENEFKEEHYRRIAYADEHFGAGVPGSRTDRGRIYIIHGPPDTIDSHPVGGPYQRTADEGGGQTSTYPFEIWRYRNIDNIGQEVIVEFVDTCGCGAYHISLDPGEKDALSHVPGAGLTTSELLGRSTKADRARHGFNTAGASLFGNNQSKQFDAIERNALVLAPPSVKYKDLKEVVDVHMRYNMLPFDMRIDFLKGSPDTTLMPVTIKVANRDLTYLAKDGVQRASLNIYGRVSTISGKIVTTFEDPLRVDVPAELLQEFNGNVSLYQQALPLRPGRYRLDLVLKDVNGGKLGTLYQSMTVPDFSIAGSLSASTLILADQLDMVPTRETGSGSFVIGKDRVRPRVPPANGAPMAFTRDEKINLWMQVYNLTIDPNTDKPSATAEYHVMNTATGKQVLENETKNLMPDLGNGATLKRVLPQGALESGTYEVKVTVYDLVSKEAITHTARFLVK
jgi:GWxTD domain-containing protein